MRRAPLLLDVAKVMQTLKRPQKAFKLATAATEVDDKLVAAWVIVCEVATAELKWALAKRAAEKWLALEPTAARAKDLLKQAQKQSK